MATHYSHCSVSLRIDGSESIKRASVATDDGTTEVEEVFAFSFVEIDLPLSSALDTRCLRQLLPGNRAMRYLPGFANALSQSHAKE